MLGIIGGTSLLEFPFEETMKNTIHTPYGSSEILTGSDIALLLRHQNRRAPHRINFRAHIGALAAYGADRIISFASTGSLTKDLAPGSLVIPDDYFSLSSFPTIFNHSIGHILPEFSQEMRDRLAEAVPDAVVGGTYVQTAGPRIETESEIRWMTGVGDIVGMTVATEACISQELKIPFASVCTVDNYANGISTEPVTYEHIVSNARLFKERTGRILDAVLKHC
jgi:5'-methylthioadenosine phosphorylase